MHATSFYVSPTQRGVGWFKSDTRSESRPQRSKTCHSSTQSAVRELGWAQRPKGLALPPVQSGRRNRAANRPLAALTKK